MRLLSLFIPVLILSFVMGRSSAHAGTSAMCGQFYQSQRDVLIYGNKFEVGRDLVDYFIRFGPRFQKIIRDLNSSHLWIDLGAGHAFAHKDWVLFHGGHQLNSQSWQHTGKTRFSYINSWWPHYKPRPESLPQMLAISFIKPPKFVELAHPSFTYKELDIAQSSLRILPNQPKASVLTDYFGNLSYTETFSQDLKKYISVLKPGGSLFVSLDNSRNTVLTASGPLKIIDWLERQPGIEVRRIWTSEILASRPELEQQGLSWDGDSFEISVNDLDAFLKTPNLKKVTYETHGAGQPTRSFTE